MNVAQLIQQLRYDLDDNVAPHLWLDDELLAYLNEAEREACRRARLLKDTETTAVCRITLSDEDDLITVDSRVLYVRRVKISTMTLPLVKKRRDQLDCERPGWDTESSVTYPEYWVMDTDSSKIRLVPPINITSGTVYAYLHVVRLPLADMTSSGSPEIPARWHMSMRQWALYQAWMKQGEDTYNPNKAAIAAAEFEREFGPRTPAAEEVWINERHGFELEGLY